MSRTIEQLQHQIENLEEILKSLKNEIEQIATIYPTPIPKEKTYTWEDSFSGNGFCVTGRGNVAEHENLLIENGNKNVAATEKVCQSHLAACMLSHIIEAINKDYQGDDEYMICCEYDEKINFYPMMTEYWALPYLKSVTGAECLIKHHTTLLKQYFGVE